MGNLAGLFASDGGLADFFQASPRARAKKNEMPVPGISL